VLTAAAVIARQVLTAAAVIGLEQLRDQVLIGARAAAGPGARFELELAAGPGARALVRGSRSGHQARRATGPGPKNGRVRWLRGHSPYFVQPAGRETLFVPRKQAPLFKNAISLGNFSQFKYNLFHENNVLQVRGAQ